METQTYNTRTEEEVSAITNQAGDEYAETVVTINAQRRDAREEGVTTHPNKLDVPSHSSDSSKLADFDEEEILTEITHIISR